LQNIVSFIDPFCKRDLYYFKEPTIRSHPISYLKLYVTYRRTHTYTHIYISEQCCSRQCCTLTSQSYLELYITYTQTHTHTHIYIRAVLFSSILYIFFAVISKTIHCIHTYICTYTYIHHSHVALLNSVHPFRCYGVATISRLLKMIGLFCIIQSLL